MIFRILVTIFFTIMFFMLFSSRCAYFLRIPVLAGMVIGIVCVWHTEAIIIVAWVLGIGRASDLVFYCCILLAFYSFFILYVKHEKVKEDITELARKSAINGARAPDGSQTHGE